MKQPFRGTQCIINFTSLWFLHTVSISANTNSCLWCDLYNRCSWVNICGTVYKPGNIVVVSSDLLPIFGNILDIIVYDITQCYFVCELLITNGFSHHYHAYEVTRHVQPRELVICSLPLSIITYLDYIMFLIAFLCHWSIISQRTFSYDVVMNGLLQLWIMYCMHVFMQTCYVVYM